MDNEKSKSISGRTCKVIGKISQDIIIFIIVAGLSFAFFSAIDYATDPTTTWQAFREDAGAVAKDFMEPTITGTPEFENEVTWSIDLMESKAPSHYNALCNNIFDIELSNEPAKEAFFAWTYSDDPTIYINEKLFKELLERKAANTNDIVAAYYVYRTLAHETAHQIQFQNGQMTDTKEMEDQALAAERDALLKLGLSPETVNEIAGDHLLESEWWND